MEKLQPVNTAQDIPQRYRKTPVGLLLEYHNLGRPFESYNSARLLIGMCMDNRKQLHIPGNFAYIIRTGGANLQYSEFKVSYAIAVGKVKHIALIGHNNCGMVNISSRKEEFIQGLVKNAGWDISLAEKHFNSYAPLFEIGDEVDFVIRESIRLRLRYPGIEVVPLIYRIEDNNLYLVSEE